MTTLYDALLAYGKSDVYPFHMPGHKRQVEDFENPFLIDITEIDGFDNLHHPEGILKEAQERAAEVYGSRSTYFLVNGSTCGILSAVSALVRPGGEIGLARNCHKASYHACYLGDLVIHSLYPQWEPKFGINGGILPEDVEKLLKDYPKTQAVLITSPTYDGAVSDVKRIAEICHAHGIPLIVDEAHGAHLGFCPYFPESALKLGADVVIQSFHKTLPSFTQTAVLHVSKSARVDEDRIRRFLGIYQSSSPSYIFMAAMDRCVEFLKNEGKERFEAFAARLEDFYAFIRGLERIRIPGYEIRGDYGIFDFDRSKILLVPDAHGGEWLAEELRKKDHLELEMAAGGYGLALTSVMDTEEGFDLVTQLVDDPDFCQKIASAREAIQNGEDFSDALNKAGIFSGIDARMVSVGFRAGAADSALSDIASRLQTETDEKLQSLAGLLEPTLVAVLSVLVGLILLSVMLPLVNVMSNIG